MQKNKKIFLAVVSILILIVLMFFYYRSILEIYYKVTGRIVEKKVSQEDFQAKNFSSDIPNPENSEDIKNTCFIAASYPNCTFIRASILNWDEHVKNKNSNSFDIVCTYGCPK